MYETLPPGGADALPLRSLCDGLTEARERTLALVEPVCPEDLDRVHDTLMSPLAWDLGHIAAFEDLWVSRAGGLPPLRPELLDVYDAEETPRAERGELDYLRCSEAREFMSQVNDRALAVLGDADLSAGADELNAAGFVWELVLQHEHQHNETMLQTLQIAQPGVFSPRREPVPSAPPLSVGGMVPVDGGPFLLGAGPGRFSYDNERPQREVELATFHIDRAPVTNADYAAWVDSGGYHRREWWSEEGWTWRTRAGVERPRYWTDDGRVRSFDRVEPLSPDRPVVHVSWHEADAYARAHGKRLPTEPEWEKAASWDPDAGVKRRFPWGDERADGERANLDQLSFGPAPVGAYPGGASAYGVLGLIGDAWEWTSSEFEPYPGFHAHPYPQYSERHYGLGYRVLRGGSWATRAHTIRPTFRSWDLASRRQIFVGFRCAAS